MPPFNRAEERQLFNSSTTLPQAHYTAGTQRPSRGPGRPGGRGPVVPQDSHLYVSRAGSPSTTTKSAIVIPPDSQAHPGPTHSRSNSLGGIRDGVGTLDRWSASTNSSRGSAKLSNSFSRRSSFGASSALGEPVALSAPLSPEKSTKSRVSTGNSPSGPLAVYPSARPPNPASLLPSIITLPSLQQPLDRSPSNLTSALTPSTSGLLSAAVKSTVPDYFGRNWEESKSKEISRRRSLSKPTTPSLDSSPSIEPSPISNLVVTKRLVEEEESTSRGHSRNRSQTTKSSSGTTSSRQHSKQPSQKAMLSKALQKANTAVLLDNAQNFEGAMQAYSEACELLQQVIVRSSGEEDRKKLEAIRNTYISRISRLETIAPHLRDDGKALPARPESDIYRSDSIRSVEDEPVIFETATVSRIVNDQSYISDYPYSRSISASQLPRRRESLLPPSIDSTQNSFRNQQDQLTSRSYYKAPIRERVLETRLNLAPPMESQYMPPPLSPRRPPSPKEYGIYDTTDNIKLSSVSESNISSASTKTLQRPPSNESMSWLDTIDESGGSTASSVHSRTSSLGVRRKHIRAASGATEAEFDAALDAAVEAAYDDGFEPMEGQESRRFNFDQDDNDEDEVVASVRRRVELAKERVRQTEREVAIHDAHERERRRILQQPSIQQSVDDIYDTNESEDEERMLDEMTRGFIMDDFEFGLQSKGAVPRESDSSGFSGRTWNSSIGSNPTTAGTMLSTVSEATALPQLPHRPRTPPTNVVPTKAPPFLQRLEPQSPAVSTALQGVRSRRLSGQNAKQLKIDTASNTSSELAAPYTEPASSVSHGQPTNAVNQANAGVFPQQKQSLLSRPSILSTSKQASSPLPNMNPLEIISPPTPTLTPGATIDVEYSGPLPRSGSPGRTQSRSGLRKNFSSSSLKNMKNRNLSVSNLDDGSDATLNTPLSSQFNLREQTGKLPAVPALPTPIAMAFKEKMNGVATGGLYLFDSDIHSPESPGSPNALSAGAPIPLEPCPTEYLLRPFWLMRAFYQTIAHPRGGYLSTKLFVPRDVWKVKGVKIKGVEDKITSCDFLTAALTKLAKVDTLDADAVLEEMQALENVLEQVQATLSKKLGNDVGVQQSNGLFKDTGTNMDGEMNGIGSKSGSISSKSSSFSWRRLRSKNSGVGLANSYSNKPSVTEGTKEGLIMGTLPMTSSAVSKVRFAKRDVNNVQYSGPNANYMGALARLFDAAQTIDQIARQVEDPGLRHADKTQVGLELCTRHAAEFFGFYICRFVLTDISMLLDKFIKRGSEWVLV